MSVETPPPSPDMVIDPPVRGESALRLVERLQLLFDRALGKGVPKELNPFLQTGTVAITMTFIAIASGIILLFWYKPSVNQAYASMEGMVNSPYTAGLLRSIHRYSSDACIFFGVIHVLRLFFQRRFSGTRWWAWITGVFIMVTLWFVGWTGYWLVWDERAQHIATGSAKMLDVLPIFVDPMGRSLLVDASVNSLLFFVIFFMHMLIPLMMGLFLWLHIARLARARFLSDKPMTLWASALLLLLCIAYPATNAAPAKMQALGQSFSMDWWYLLPIPFTDRYGAWTLWAAFIGITGIFMAVPWILARKAARPATVDGKRCNECKACFNDCPYDAISMVPRTEGNMKFETQAFVNADKCVGCGICVGSCDSIGTNLNWFGVTEQRERMDRWIEREVAAGNAPSVAYVCAESAGSALDVNPDTGTCDELPGYLVLKVPCAGWVQPLSVERALRRGAKQVLITSCGPAEERYREGGKWMQMRFDGERKPELRADKVNRDDIHLLAFDRRQKSSFLAEARALREGGALPAPTTPSKPLGMVAAAALAVLIAGILGYVSDYGYTAPTIEGSELVINFKHPGSVAEHCRDLTPEEKAARPVHMQQTQICDRRRADVRLRVSIDGENALTKSFPAKGLWGDGVAVGYEPISVTAGKHRIEVAIGDTSDPEEWTFQAEQELEFTTEERRVMAFDRISGFLWY